MAARTCLLCGKPLSRIWAGTGEDFCSQEHRNQYRLRRGMDRLLEADKHANAMRRRESPRQIPAAQLRAGGDAAPRGFPNPQRLGESQAAFRHPDLRPAAKLGLPPTGRFLRPIANSAVGPIALPPPAGFTARARAALATAPAARLEARVAAAPPVEAVPALADVEKRRRIAAAPRGKRKPVSTMPARKAARVSCGFAAPPRNIAAAAEGRALRVSMSSGFRVPEWRLRAAVVPAPAIAGMRWPDVRALDASAAPAPPRPDIRSIAIAAPEMRIPAAPPPDLGPRLRWPGAMAISMEFLNAAHGQRSAFVPFGLPEESAKERR